MLKFVMLPPLSAERNEWAERLQEALPNMQIVVAKDDETAKRELLDVFEVEPLPAEHKLWTLPNVLLTPHVASKDAENIEERQFQILLDNARRFVAGEPLRNVVNKALWY